MPNFTLQKEEGCLDSVVEKAIMKMQKKTQRHTRGLSTQFIDFCTSYNINISTTRWNEMIFSTLFLPIG